MHYIDLLSGDPIYPAKSFSLRQDQKQASLNVTRSSCMMVWPSIKKSPRYKISLFDYIVDHKEPFSEELGTRLGPQNSFTDHSSASEIYTPISWSWAQTFHHKLKDKDNTQCHQHVFDTVICQFKYSSLIRIKKRNLNYKWGTVHISTRVFDHLKT